MLSKDLTKETLYTAVKTIYDSPHDHIHLNQQKLYTLFSAAFNYMLYKSSKEPGHYIIRVQDSYLFDKIVKRAKDPSTRKFMQKLGLPRRLKYGNSTFHLDFFNISTWTKTNDLPKKQIKGAIVVKNTSKQIMDTPTESMEEADKEFLEILKTLPSDYYISMLAEFVPKTITIAFDEEYDDLAVVKFDFIKEAPREENLKGVKISSDVDLDSLED